jgi:glucose-1-phosphate cytidylyltransferase
LKAVILAGGLGTRLSEETVLKPKPMVEIAGKPILWHIMKIYSAHGINDFVICLGYKGYVIKEYFANYFLHTSDVTFDMVNNDMTVHHKRSEPWKITLVDTGASSGTGGRLRRVRDYLGDEDFCFTYGDGVSNVDVGETIRFHKEHGKLVTVTAIQLESKYGLLTFNGNEVTHFREKPTEESSWINGGFFIVSPKAIDYIANDQMHWENDPMHCLVGEKQVSAYFHKGFWHCMDTLRDKQNLEAMWEAGNPPWKLWS